MSVSQTIPSEPIVLRSGGTERERELVGKFARPVDIGEEFVRPLSRQHRLQVRSCQLGRIGVSSAFALTPGNVADISMAVPLLKVASPTKRLLADKAYDADSLLLWLLDPLRDVN